jgi:Uma2 family endonuclease
MTVIQNRPPSTPPRLPPLHNGDRLTRDEFERRYEAMPADVKAELIEGVVYIVTPVNEEFHSEPHLDMATWIGLYRIATPGIVGGDNGTVRLDLDNEPQPDLYLRMPAWAGGQAKRDSDGYVEGAPELVVEVAASSASYDLGPKLNVYRRNGVREYIVKRTYNNAIDWFILRHGQYEPLAPGPDGILRSEVFPGLWLDAAALLRGDMLTVIRVAQDGISSPEHAAFVQRLKSP